MTWTTHGLWGLLVVAAVAVALIGVASIHDTRRRKAETARRVAEMERRDAEYAALRETHPVIPWWRSEMQMQRVARRRALRAAMRGKRPRLRRPLRHWRGWS